MFDSIRSQRERRNKNQLQHMYYFVLFQVSLVSIAYANTLFTLRQNKSHGHQVFLYCSQIGKLYMCYVTKNIACLSYFNTLLVLFCY